MKKFLFLGTMMLAVLAFSFTAVADEVDCGKCKGFGLADMGCPTGVQDECEGTEVDWGNVYFPICDCEDANTNFRQSTLPPLGGADLDENYIGVRIKILTPGVYFSNATGFINFWAYESESALCADAYRRGGDFKLGSFSVVYYDDLNCIPGDELDEGDINGVGLDCELEPNEKAVSLATRGDTAANVADTFFLMPDADETKTVTAPYTAADYENWAGYSYWNIQIPPLRYDASEVMSYGYQAEKVLIKIELVAPGVGGICQGPCNVICECTVEIAEICPDEYGCLVFPYVITQYTPWITGIAVNNVGALPASQMEATFIITDADGNQFSYTKDDFSKRNWSNVVDSMLGDFDGTPAAGNAWLKVVTNFKADGYSFMTDGVFGGSTLPRFCDSHGNIKIPCCY
jgi:hypothetical protein